MVGGADFDLELKCSHSRKIYAIWRETRAWECLHLTPTSALNFNFLLMQILGGSRDGSSDWRYGEHTWVLGIMGTGGSEPTGRSLRVSICVKESIPFPFSQYTTPDKGESILNFIQVLTKIALSLWAASLDSSGTKDHIFWSAYGSSMNEVYFSKWNFQKERKRG